MTKLTKIFIHTFALLSIFSLFNQGFGVSVQASKDYTYTVNSSDEQCNNKGPVFCNIQDAVDFSKNRNYTEIFISNGEYQVDSAIILPYSNMKLIGESRSGVKINITEEAYRGFGVSGDNVWISNMTITAPTDSTIYPVYVKGVPSPVLNNTVQQFHLINTTISGGRAGIDMSGVNNSRVENVKAYGAVMAGVQISDSTNVTFRDLHVRDNGLYGVGIFTHGRYHQGGVDNIRFIGDNIFGDSENLNDLYTETGNHADPTSPYPITNVSFSRRLFKFAATHNIDNGNKVQTIYFPSLDRVDYYTNLVKQVYPDLVYSVRALTDSNKLYVINNDTPLQTAIDAANPGDTIKIMAGTFQNPEGVVIDKPLTIYGMGKVATTLDGTGTSGVTGVSIQSDDVSITSVAVVNYDTGVEINADNTTLNNLQVRRSSIGSGTIGIDFAKEGNNNTIKNTIVKYFDKGFNLQYSQNNSVHNNNLVRSNNVGIYSTANQPSLNIVNGEVRNNYDHGVQHTGTGSINMVNIWWGTTTGPLDTNPNDGSLISQNTHGEGNQIDGNIKYFPWAMTKFY